MTRERSEAMDMTEAANPIEAELIRALSELLPAPETPLARARVRARVMAAAREQLEPTHSPAFGPVGLAAAAASAVIALGSGGAIGASASALPGEPLYSVKLAVEEAQVVLASVSGDPVAQVNVHEERASKRVAEIEKLVSQNRAVPPAVAQAATSHNAAAATAIAKVPEPKRPDVERKSEASQLQREETLGRVITQVPPTAQAAISTAIARQQERREAQEDRREEREDDRRSNSGPGSNSGAGPNSGPGPNSGSGSNSGGSSNSGPGPNRNPGSNNGSGGGSRTAESAAPPSQLPAAIPRATEQPRIRPTEPPRDRGGSNSGPGNGSSGPGNGSNNSSGNSGRGR